MKAYKLYFKFKTNPINKKDYLVAFGNSRKEAKETIKNEDIKIYKTQEIKN